VKHEPYKVTNLTDCLLAISGSQQAKIHEFCFEYAKITCDTHDKLHYANAIIAKYTIYHQDLEMQHCTTH